MVASDDITTVNVSRVQDELRGVINSEEIPGRCVTSLIKSPSFFRMGNVAILHLTAAVLVITQLVHDQCYCMTTVQC